MKFKKSEFVCAAISASLLTAWMPASAQDGPVSSQDIQASWVGKTMVGTIGNGPAAGKPLEFTMNVDGSLNTTVTQIR